MDYQISGTVCPHCGQAETRYRECDNLGCDDGFIDEYDDDPCYALPGDFSPCSECRGTGSVQWCPQCGNDPRARPKTT